LYNKSNTGIMLAIY